MLYNDDGCVVRVAFFGVSLVF